MLRIGSGCVRVLTLALFTSTLVYAQYPVKQIRLIVPNAPGGGSTPDEYGAYVRSEVEKWAKVIKATGAKAD